MNPAKLLEILHLAECLKENTRHAYTTHGRHESVAEHSWRLCLFAFFVQDEFPQLDMGKVLRMCLIHDLGECFTGDIPSFEKSARDAAKEDDLLLRWVSTLPEPYRGDMTRLYAEMGALETDEARLYKALDKLEAVVQHNESPLDTWLPLEHQLNLVYGDENVAFSPYLAALRSVIRSETEEKLKKADHH